MRFKLEQILRNITKKKKVRFGSDIQALFLGGEGIGGKELGYHGVSFLKFFFIQAFYLKFTNVSNRTLILKMVAAANTYYISGSQHFC